MFTSFRSWPWAISIYCLVLISIIPSFFLSYPIPSFFTKLQAFLWTFLFSLSLIVLGIELSNRIPLLSGSVYGTEEWKIIYSFGLGLGLLGSFVLILGKFIPGVLSVKMGLAFGVLLFLLIIRFPVLGQFEKVFRKVPTVTFSALDLSLLFLAFLGLSVSFVSCFSPITYYDSLVYHLALPNLYLQQGSIGSVPHNLFSQFPALMEMVFLFALSQFPEPEFCINLVSWLMSILLGYGIFLWVSELVSRRAGVLALALWWTMPAVLFLSIGAYVDVPLAFFIFLAIRSFCSAKEKKWDKRYLFVAGLFSGFACSVKYTGATCAIILSLFMMVGFFRHRDIPIKNFLIFVSGVLIPFSIWLIKNAVEVGNPVFPFLYSVLGGDVGWTNETASAYFRMLTEYGAKSNVFLELLLSPFSIVSSSLKFGGGFDVLGDLGWPLFVLTSPFLIFFREKKVKILGFYALCHFIIWFSTKPVLRFLIPLLPILVILTVVTLSKLRQQNAKVFSFVSLLFILPLITSNIYLFFFVSRDLKSFHVPLGFEERESFLTKRLSYYRVFDFLNKNLSPSDKVLLVGEQRAYHLKMPYLASNLFAPSQISKICNKANSPDGVFEQIKSLGVSHILVNEGEVQRLGGLKSFGFNSIGEKNFKAFLDGKAAHLGTDKRVALYKV